MTYPRLPFALVSFLADATPERAGLEKGPNHVTTVVQSGVNVLPSRFAMTEDGHYAEMLERTLANYAQADDVDTVALIFPVTSGEPMDMGVLLEGGKPASTFRWTYAPRFGIHLPPQAQTDQMVRDAHGVAIIQAMLDRDARRRVEARRPLPAIGVGGVINPGYDLLGVARKP